MLGIKNKPKSPGMMSNRLTCKDLARADEMYQCQGITPIANNEQQIEQSRALGR